MTELAARRRRDRDDRRTMACFCGSCQRILYVDVAETMFCPVCSSTVVAAEEIELREEERSPNR